MFVGVLWLLLGDVFDEFLEGYWVLGGVWSVGEVPGWPVWWFVVGVFVEVGA